MDRIKAFLRSLETLDKDTLSYLCGALDDNDFDSLEMQDFFEPFLSAEDVDSLLKILPTSSQHHVGAMSLDSAFSLQQPLGLSTSSKLLPKAAMCDEESVETSATNVAENVAECTPAVEKVARVGASQFGREKATDTGADLDLEERDLSTDHTYFQEAGSIKKGDHLMIKGQPCRVVQISASKIWKGPYRGCFQAQIIARDIFTGKKYEHAYPVSQQISMPFVKREEYTVIDIGNDGELSLLTATCDMKIDVNLPTETDADLKVAECIKTDFNEGKTLAVIVQSACGIEKVIQYKCLD